MSATTTTDTAYLAIIDDLEARLGASRGWWKRLRAAEARIAALEVVGDRLARRVGHAPGCPTNVGGSGIATVPPRCWCGRDDDEAAWERAKEGEG
jgi:hypothetical protein